MSNRDGTLAMDSRKVNAHGLMKLPLGHKVGQDGYGHGTMQC